MVDTALFSIYPNNIFVKSFHRKVEKIASINELELKRKKMLQAGEKFPDLPFVLSNNQEFRITGRWYRLLFINFNAANCLSCVNDDELINIYRAYSSKGLIVLNIEVDINNKYEVYGPSYDTLGFHNATINNSWNKTILDTLKITSLPANFLIDRRSDIRAVNLKGDDFRKKLKELLP
jgi:hypothetical protein